MKLYGTITSPYTRRVRALALELGVETELVDTLPEAGQAALRAVTPLWRIPTAEIDGQVIWDSAAITEQLLATRGSGALRPVKDLVRERNLRFVIDGALDAAISVFYFEREGVHAKDVPYLTKQNARIEASLAYLAREIEGGFVTDDARFGVTELALATTLEWFVFRDRFPIDTIPALREAMQVHRERPSLVATRPA